MSSEEKKDAFQELLEMRERIAALKAKRKFEEWPFSITSLMDAMTILLVFLLISLTSDPLNIKQDAALKLPESMSPFKPADIIPITITKRALLVDKDFVLPIRCRIGNAECPDKSIERKAACDQHPEKCSPQEIQTLNSMYFYIDKTYLKESNENVFLITQLEKVLERKKKLREELLKRLGKRPSKKDNYVNIICDKDIPIKIIYQVLNTAQIAGFNGARFAVIYEGQ